MSRGRERTFSPRSMSRKGRERSRLCLTDQRTAVATSNKRPFRRPLQRSVSLTRSLSLTRTRLSTATFPTSSCLRLGFKRQLTQARAIVADQKERLARKKEHLHSLRRTRTRPIQQYMTLSKTLKTCHSLDKFRTRSSKLGPR